MRRFIDIFRDPATFEHKRENVVFVFWFCIITCIFVLIFWSLCVIYLPSNDFVFRFLAPLLLFIGSIVLAFTGGIAFQVLLFEKRGMVITKSFYQELINFQKTGEMTERIEKIFKDFEWLKKVIRL